MKTAAKLLEESTVRKIKSTYVKALSEFEKKFPEKVNSQEYEAFRSNLMHHGEDCVRSLKQEIKVFTIEYSPIKKDGNTTTVNKDILDILGSASLEFNGILPVIKLKAAKRELLDAIRDTVDVGMVLGTGGTWELISVGADVVKRLLPLMDKLPIRYPGNYDEWIGKVHEYYLNRGEG